MVQVKKPAVRDAILTAAYKLFRQRGYNGATIAQITTEAGVSTANFYSYFDSKIDVLYTIYDPWLRERLERLELEVASITDTRKRLHRILTALWRDIPLASNGFSNNIMQAVSGLGSDERYDPSALLSYEAKVGKMILKALPAHRCSNLDMSAIAHIIFMTFDGFAISAHANPRAACSKGVINQFADLLLGEPERTKPDGRSGHARPRERNTAQLRRQPRH